MSDPFQKPVIWHLKLILRSKVQSPFVKLTASQSLMRQRLGEGGVKGTCPLNCNIATLYAVLALTACEMFACPFGARI